MLSRRWARGSLWAVSVWIRLPSDQREFNHKADTPTDGTKVKILCQELCTDWLHVCRHRMSTGECESSGYLLVGVVIVILNSTEVEVGVQLLSCLDVLWVESLV